MFAQNEKMIFMLVMTNTNLIELNFDNYLSLAPVLINVHVTINIYCN